MEKNSYLEILLDYLKIKIKKFNYVKFGHSLGDDGLGFYHFWNEDTLRFGIVLSDIKLYADRRVKKITKKEARCLKWFIPATPQHEYLNEIVINEIVSYFSGKSTTMKFFLVKGVDMTAIMDSIEKYLNEP